MIALQTAALPVDRQPAELLGFAVPVLDAMDDASAWLAAHGGSVEILITHAMRGAPAALLDRLPKLRLIANFGAGVDLIDFDSVRVRGILVTASGDLLADDVADLAIWQILTLLRGLDAADGFVRSGRWQDGAMPLGRSARGRRLGLLGFGRIGQAIAQRANALGMIVRYNSRRPVSGAGYGHDADRMRLAGWADTLVVALPGGAETNGIVDRQLLDALGPDGFLVNVARGSIVDEAALASALVEGRLAGAALDVFGSEPKPAAALFEAPNLLMTPHIGSATVDVRRAMLEQIVADVRSFAAGGPLANAL